MRRRVSPRSLALLLALPVVLLGAIPAHPSDTKPFLQFLFGVYTVTWAGFFAYAYFMSRRQRELRRDIDALLQMPDEPDATARKNPTAAE